jgi:uncharacterized protein YodC (DUF2158 family)
MLFKLWETVKLKTDGFVMTITTFTTDASGNQSATCKWNDDDKQLNMSNFSLNDLITFPKE